MFPNHSRIVQACTSLGLDMMPGILWHKPTNSPNKFMGSGMLPAGAYMTLEHEHILSGIVKCPICGSGMYGNVNRKKRKDGTLYKDYFYYACKHRTFIDGHHCTYKKQWNEDKVNDAVAEIIGKLGCING
jgi:hypothetical protein